MTKISHLLWNSSPHVPCFLLYVQREEPILSRVLPFGIHPPFQLFRLSLFYSRLSLTPNRNHQHWSFSIQSVSQVHYLFSHLIPMISCLLVSYLQTLPPPTSATYPARAVIKDFNDSTWAAVPGILNPPSGHYLPCQSHFPPLTLGPAYVHSAKGTLGAEIFARAKGETANQITTQCGYENGENNAFRSQLLHETFF